MPSLGWDRAYRSGDLVRFDEVGPGLRRSRRRPGQGRRAPDRARRGRQRTARRCPASAGRRRRSERPRRGQPAARRVRDGRRRASRPRAAAEHLRRDDARRPWCRGSRWSTTLPTRTSGKIDRDALPWPLPAAPAVRAPMTTEAELTGTAAGSPSLGWRPRLDAGGSGGGLLRPRRGQPHRRPARLAASGALPRRHRRGRLREPVLADLAGSAGRDEHADRAAQRVRVAGPAAAPGRRRSVASAACAPSAACAGSTWVSGGVLVARGVARAVLAARGRAGGGSLLGWLLLINPVGPHRAGGGGRPARAARGRAGAPPPRRTGPPAAVARRAPRRRAGSRNLSAAPLDHGCTRGLLGAQVGRHVHLHASRPVTGLLALGDGCSVEPEVDLAGHWLDGDILHVGRCGSVPAPASVPRSTLLPGAGVGDGAEVAPGQRSSASVPAGRGVVGGPGRGLGLAHGAWTPGRPENRPVWLAAYAASAVTLSLLPRAGRGSGRGRRAARRGGDGLARPGLGGRAACGSRWRPWWAWRCLPSSCSSPCGCSSLGLEPGHHPVHSRLAWQAWSMLRVLDEART